MNLSVFFSIPQQSVRTAPEPLTSGTSKALRALYVFVALVLCVNPAKSQGGPDIQRGWSTSARYDANRIDKVDVATGNLDVRIPLITIPQKGGKLDIKLSIYFGADQWWLDYSQQYFVQWRTQQNYTNSQLGVTISNNFGVREFDTADPNTNQPFYSLVYDDGASKTLGFYPDPLSPQSNSIGTTVDGSGWKFDSQSFVHTPDGVRIGSPDYVHPNTAITDSNGNSMTGHQASLGDFPVSITDTMNRTIPTGYLSSQYATQDLAGCPGGTVDAFAFPFPGPNGGTIQIKACRGTYTVSSNFGVANTHEGTYTGVSMINGIVLPDGTSWQFSYDSWGNLQYIRTPQQGVISYTWQTINTLGLPNTPLARVVRTRTEDDGNTQKVWTYDFLHSSSTEQTTTVTMPDNTLEVYTVDVVPQTTSNVVTQKITKEASGAVVKTESTGYSWGGVSYCAGFAAGATFLLPTSQTLTWANGQTMKTTTNYQNAPSFNCPGGGAPIYTAVYQNPSEEDVYDYGSGAPGPLLRKIVNGYVVDTQPAYAENNLINLPAQTTIYDGNSAQVAQATFGYDDSNNGSPAGARGNQTSAARWLNTGGQVATSAVYNSDGTVAKTYDGKLQITSYGYSANQIPPTSIARPSTNGISHSESFSWDSAVGQMTSYTDENGNIFSYTYDLVGRLWAVHNPDTGSSSYSVIYCYPTPATVTEIRALSSPLNSLPGNSATCPNSASQWQTTYSYDQFGRPVRTSLDSDPSGAVLTDTTYDLRDRVHSTSNPYRSTSDSTYGVTTLSYDATGRMTGQSNPDQSSRQWSFSGSSMGLTDETSNHWTQTTDALGRLTKVTEPGSLATNYAYDALGNLTSANQAGVSGDTPRTRSFSYDSLSRLITSTNPETGTICYGQWNGGSCANGYDANSNLLYKTDARGITTSYLYDPLNRLLSKTHSDGTPTTVYNYEQTGSWGAGSCGSGSPTGFMQCNTVGRVSSATVDNVTTSIFGYDAMGRMTMKATCLAFICGTNQINQYFTYDLAGNPTSSDHGTNVGAGIYFGGHGMSYDSAGRLQAVTAYQGPGTPSTLFSANSYGPVGLLNSTLGSGTQESRMYDSRLRQTSYLASGTSAVNGSGVPYGVVNYAQNDAKQTGVIAQGDDLHVWGWGASSSGCPVGAVQIYLGTTQDHGTYIGDATIGLTGYLYTPGYMTCGFDFNDSVGDIAPGNYYVNVYAIQADGTSGALGNHWPVTVTNTLPPGGGINYALNPIDQSQNFVSGGKIDVVGWAIDSQQHAPVGAVQVTIDGNVIGYATLGIPRGDVQQVIGNGDPTFIPSGYEFLGSIGDIASGTHNVGVTMYDPLGQHAPSYSVYQIQVAADTATTYGDVNSINFDTNSSIAAGSTLVATGWAANPSDGDCGVNQTIELYLGSQLLGTATRGIARQDITNLFNNQNCGAAGWTLSAPLTGVPPGRYNLYIRVYDSAGGSQVLPAVNQVFVTPQGGLPLPSSSQLPTNYAWSVGYAPNGNIDSAYDSVNGNWAYLYDNLNRLVAAGSAAAGLDWNYDSFGNMLTQTITSGMGVSWEHAYDANNRLAGICMDASGNELDDFWCYSTLHEYGWDAEGRMTGSQWGSTRYLYDAEGQRIAKTDASGNLQSMYLYDAQGHMVTELDGSLNPARREVYAGSRHLGTYSGNGPVLGAGAAPLYYAFADWIGTERMRTDASGVPCMATTSQPFGDNQRNSGSCWPTNDFFTGKERDSESGLDYFGARYYASNMGRFMSPDWSSNPSSVPFGNIYHPQSMNLYSYVGNNPITGFDPYGHLDCSAGATQDVACAVTDAAKSVWNWLGGRGGSSGAGSSSNPIYRVTSSISSWSHLYSPNFSGVGVSGGGLFSTPLRQGFAASGGYDFLAYNTGNGELSQFANALSYGYTGLHYTQPGGVAHQTHDDDEVDGWGAGAEAHASFGRTSTFGGVSTTSQSSLNIGAVYASWSHYEGWTNYQFTLGLGSHGFGFTTMQMTTHSNVIKPNEVP